jgi:hypothetical protein
MCACPACHTWNRLNQLPSFHVTWYEVSVTNGHKRGYIQKFPVWVHNEIYAYNNKHWLRSSTKGYGGKTH